MAAVDQAEVGARCRFGQEGGPVVLGELLGEGGDVAAVGAQAGVELVQEAGVAAAGGPAGVVVVALVLQAGLSSGR